MSWAESHREAVDKVASIVFQSVPQKEKRSIFSSFQKSGVGFDSHRPLHKCWVRPGDIGNSLYRRHGLHFWAERVFEWFEHPCPDDVLLPAVPPKSPLQGLL